MKKNYFFLLALLLGINYLNANPVDMEKAKAVGHKFVSTKFNKELKTNNLQLVYTGVSNRGETCFYAFNTGENGFVIVSADDRFRPIVGYSDESLFETENMSPELAFYLDRITEARTSGNAVIDSNTPAEWQSIMKTGQLLSHNRGRGVDYICTTKWNQNSPYNLYAPEASSGPGGRCYAGCVATAMSQVMKRWDHPTQGTGSHGYYSNYGYLSADFGQTSYNWEHMPDRLTGVTQEEIEAVALLMYHCGVAVDMNFSPTGSGAYSSEVPYAISQYFSYSNHSVLKERYEYALTDWQNMLKESFDKGWPVYYSGCSDSGCHAFVCDGYDDNDLFHFNWGWGGSSDGWFVIDEIDYASWAEIVVNYVPSNVYEFMPMQPDNFTVVPSNDLDYSAILTWNNPTHNIHSEALTNIDQVVITRNGKIVHTEDNASPGASMSFTDHFMPAVANYNIYAVVNGAKGLESYEKGVLIGPSCPWTVEMSSSNPQGWKGGTLSFINGAGNEVALLSLESAQATQTFTLPLGHIEIRWQKPQQAIDELEFKVKNAEGLLKAHFRGSSSEIQNGLFYIANNTCVNQDEEIGGTLLTATIANDQVTLTWEAVDNSVNYLVFRDGILFGITTDTSFVDEDTKETFHTYHVTAFTSTGESLPSNTCSYHPESPCVIPTNLYVEKATPVKATLAWDAPEDETVAGYMLYRRPKGGEFKRIKLTSNTTYTDNLSSQPDGIYEYAVTAYYQETQCESGYASAAGHPELNFAAFNKTIIPQHLDYLVHEGRVILQWEKGSMAEGYNVYRDGEQIAHGVSENTFVDYSATPQQSYHYFITGHTAHIESSPSNGVYVDWATDINENASNQEVSIYPNPTENTVTVEAENLRQVRVFNMMGQEMKCKASFNGGINIDLSELPKGCYFIETTTEQGRSTATIVKL